MSYNHLMLILICLYCSMLRVHTGPMGSGPGPRVVGSAGRSGESGWWVGRVGLAARVFQTDLACHRGIFPKHIPFSYIGVLTPRSKFVTSMTTEKD